MRVKTLKAPPPSLSLSLYLCLQKRRSWTRKGSLRGDVDRALTAIQSPLSLPPPPTSPRHGNSSPESLSHFFPSMFTLHGKNIPCSHTIHVASPMEIWRGRVKFIVIMEIPLNLNLLVAVIHTIRLMFSRIDVQGPINRWGRPRDVCIRAWKCYTYKIILRVI